MERLSAVVDFVIFWGPLVAGLCSSPRDKGDRPPSAPVLMFKILILRRSIRFHPYAE